MKEKVLFVMNGFLKLSVEERKEFINEVNKYLEKKTAREQQEILDSVRESHQVMTLGPIKITCTCCGK